MRPAIQAILTEVVKYEQPAAFEIDVARDIEYLYNHDTKQFVWCLYRNGTQLLPAATDIPSPFQGNPAFEGVEYAQAFLRTYGEGDSTGHDTKWFVFDSEKLLGCPAQYALDQLAEWKRDAARELKDRLTAGGIAFSESTAL